MGPYIADFFCNRLKLVIEVDGPIHERQRGYDEARDQWLSRRGYKVLRLTNAVVLDRIHEVLQTIEAEVRQSPYGRPSPGPSRVARFARSGEGS
jgi:very-short-patch-repair endonuclease